MKYKIVPIGEDHWAQLPDIHRAAIFAVTDDYYDQKALESWAHGLIPEGYKHSADDGEVFNIALDEHGSPVGFCGYRGYEIMGLFVAPEHQNRGVGTALVNKAIQEILKGRPEKITLTASHPSLAFFQNEGFHIVKEREEITRGGVFIPVYDMEAPLQGPPHEGHELEMMIEGKKKLAYFAEDAPEERFRPYVLAGKIKRHEWRERAAHLEKIMRDSGQIDIVPTTPIIFYLPHAEAEKDRLIELLTKHQIHREYDVKDEREMGELLGYPPYAVKAFMERMRALRQN